MIFFSVKMLEKCTARTPLQPRSTLEPGQRAAALESGRRGRCVLVLRLPGLCLGAEVFQVAHVVLVKHGLVCVRLAVILQKLQRKFSILNFLL
jgi:hypothetical protein